MAPPSHKKRKLEDGMRGKTSRPKKKIRKQKAYHSSSEDDNEDEEASDTGFAPVNLQDSDEEVPSSKPLAKALRVTEQPPVDSSASEAEEDSGSTGDEEDLEDEDEASDAEIATNTQARKKSKRNDPEAFSQSMTKILSTKLSQSARKDPVLSRSREVAEAQSTAADARLESKAKAKLRAEKKQEKEKGRIKDVLGIERGIAGAVAEEEKRLRRIATKGVIQLFNAFHAAHVRAEETTKSEKRKGTVGMGNREEKVNEMSKQGFLELIGGKKKPEQLQQT